jgi:hypothetical protein
MKNKRSMKDQVFVPIDLPESVEQELRKGRSQRHQPLNEQITRELTQQIEAWDHPVKSLKFGSVTEQDQLAPSDLLPVKVQFNNSIQS